MKNLYISLCCLMFLLISTNASARRKPKVEEDPKKSSASVIENFTSYYMAGVDEKLYLQTDKPYYGAGENIWIKGYLLNSITHRSLEFSNYIYVELIEPQGEVVSRVKIKRDSVGFNGYMYLEPKLKTGDYLLRGYTKWMTNGDTDFLFKKNIEVVSPIVSDYAATEQEDSRATKKSKAVDVDQSAPQGLDYDLQFFPEGGNLLDGVMQQVAFKALAEDGLSIGVEGTIYNAADEPICDIESVHKGMGVITLCAFDGESYYAEVKSDDGRTKRFDLPVVEPQGAALKVACVGDRYIYQVQTQTPEVLSGSKVIIHSRGEIIAVDESIALQAHFVNSNNLNDGVCVFSLVSADDKVISERVIFKKPSQMPAVTIESNASNYSRRQRASLKINVTGSDGAPAQGEFAVAVTDNASVHLDPLNDNILSYLLLSSEIKGYVEDPMFYFSSTHAETTRYLDLVMMTQGWRRFDLEQILAGITPVKMYNYEETSTISGRVKGFFGNAARNPKITILCSRLNYADMFELDKSQMFRVEGLLIPDSTDYVLQALGKSGGKTLALEMDPELFPESECGVFERKEELYVPEAFVNQTTQKYFYDGGMSIIDLEAVEVVANQSLGTREGYDEFATVGSSRSDLEHMSGVTFPNIIQSYPGMRVTTLGANYRNDTAMVRFLVDDNYVEYSSVEYLTADDIEFIGFYYGANAVEYMDAGGGIFVITLREGSKVMEVQRPNIAVVSHLGYQEPTEFYQPAYGDPKVSSSTKPDLRTTIYWNGALTPDANGDIEFDLFTADNATSYTVTFEGVTTEGEICQGSATINRTLTY